MNAQKRKRSRKKQVRKKKKKPANFGKRATWIIGGGIVLAVGIWFGITFKEGLSYFLKKDSGIAEERSIYDIRNMEVLHRHSDRLVGFDVSHYQGRIVWEKIDSISGIVPLDFVFIRATMGLDGKDKTFDANWRAARANHFIRGAYHYYRPDENSVAQAHNFIKNVRLSAGDLPPVLDIEELPKGQSLDSLRMGLSRWIKMVEEEYQVKPILYSGEHFYSKHLQKWFSDYVLWIANYNFFVEEIKPEWHFWQFTEKGLIDGIEGKVDVNVFNGNRQDIRKLLIR